MAIEYKSSQAPKPNLPPVVELFGDEYESFYQLGLLDKDRHKMILNHMLGLIQTPWQSTDKAAQELFKQIAELGIDNNQEFKNKMKHYAQGLEEDEKLLTAAYLIPEVMSCLSGVIKKIKTELSGEKIPEHLLHTIQALSSKIFGCSSYFAINSKSGALMHARILDFPLFGSFDKQERILSTCWNKNKTQVISLGSIGFPYPSITALNSNGLSFALHQKFTNDFNRHGSSIFEIVNKMANEAKNLEDIIQIAKSNPSITTWCLHVGEDLKGAEGPRVLELDIMGSEIIYKIHQVSENKVLHFHNQLIDKKINQEEVLPYSIHSYNQMRACSAQNKVKRIESRMKRNKNGLNEESFLKEVSQLEEIKVKDQFEKWDLDSITPSSVTCAVLCPKEGQVYAIAGEAPKMSEYYFVTNKIWVDKKRFEKVTLELKKFKSHKTKSRDYLMRVKGWKELMSAQASFDNKNRHGVYHHLQMSIDYFEQAKSVEKNYPHFYLLAFQFMWEEHPKNQYKNLCELHEIVNELPSYLRDHCYLIITRLERILKHDVSYNKDQINHPKLKDLFTKEEMISNRILHQVVSKTMNPRMDIMDIIYPHEWF